MEEIRGLVFSMSCPVASVTVPPETLIEPTSSKEAPDPSATADETTKGNKPSRIKRIWESVDVHDFKPRVPCQVSVALFAALQAAAFADDKVRPPDAKRATWQTAQSLYLSKKSNSVTQAFKCGFKGCIAKLRVVMCQAVSETGSAATIDLDHIDQYSLEIISVERSSPHIHQPELYTYQKLSDEHINALKRESGNSGSLVSRPFRVAAAAAADLKGDGSEPGKISTKTWNAMRSSAARLSKASKDGPARMSDFHGLLEQVPIYHRARLCLFCH